MDLLGMDRDGAIPDARIVLQQCAGDFQKTVQSLGLGGRDVAAGGGPGQGGPPGCFNLWPTKTWVAGSSPTKVERVT